MSTLKIACISDVHLGHTRTSTAHILNNLNTYLLGHKDFAELDILFIAGDLFDRLLAYDDPDLLEIYLWFSHLVQKCAESDVYLRVLKGTPSHDWEQCSTLEMLPAIANRISKDQVDYKYHRSLSIEYIEKFGIHVLYVPDEWRHTNEETLIEVKALLKAKGLEQVDYAIMHGLFEYQCPAQVKGIPTHNAQEYLDLVKQLIFIGHIHTHTRYNRIVAQGSFDRLSHNEEEAKGFCIAHVNDLEDTRQVYFIENKGARTYKSIDCQDLQLQEALTYIQSQVKDLPDYSAVRVIGHKGSELLSDVSVFLRMRPLISWTTKAIGDKDKTMTDTIRLSSIHTSQLGISITPDNITHLVFSRPAFQSCEVQILHRAKEHLEQLR